MRRRLQKFVAQHQRNKLNHVSQVPKLNARNIVAQHLFRIVFSFQWEIATNRDPPVGGWLRGSQAQRWRCGAARRQQRRQLHGGR